RTWLVRDVAETRACVTRWAGEIGRMGRGRARHLIMGMWCGVMMAALGGGREREDLPLIVVLVSLLKAHFLLVSQSMPMQGCSLLHWTLTISTNQRPFRPNERGYADDSRVGCRPGTPQRATANIPPQRCACLAAHLITLPHACRVARQVRHVFQPEIRHARYPGGTGGCS
ncbi:hypothetical protein BC567DRAFT_231561, partial [Phyllosticta citribraziliensis]